MFFPISKIAGFGLQPVNAFALALLLGLVLGWTRWPFVGRAIVTVTALLFIVCCFSPLGALELRVLEDRFPHPGAALPAPTGIIVLGGSIDEEISRARGEIAIPKAATRLTAAVVLARRYPGARLVFSGGSADTRKVSHPEAEGVKVLWGDLGVPAARMSFEDRSRNTYENAQFTRDLLAPKPGDTWLLVTSAAHMPRSMGLFRRAGFNVTAYPVDYLTFGDWRDWKPSMIAIDMLDRLETATHEWVGLVAYRLRGKTDDLFPQP